VISILASSSLPDGIEMTADIDGTIRRISYTAIGAGLEPSADAAVAAMLMPAMSTRGPLVAPEPISPRLAAAIPKIQEILRSWEQRIPAYSRYAAVPVEAAVRQQLRLRPKRRVAAFFTGGVDSFYTVARHRDEIDMLVYVHGFDVRLDDSRFDELVITQLRLAAAALGKPLVEVWTNLRSVTDRYTDWTDYHGSALASVALILASEFERIYIPATLTYAHLIPLGSHPLLDPLWSTEDVEIVHDGCEASRLDKLSAISDDVVARSHLRVCWKNRAGRYNCGSCEKCLRTMVALQALGVLHLFETFPDVVDPASIARTDLPEVRFTWEASLALLKQTNGDPRLARALDRRLHSARARFVHGGIRVAYRVRDLMKG
jgi:hypothetical protein